MMTASAFLRSEGMCCHSLHALEIDELLRNRFDLVVTTWTTNLRIANARVYEDVAGETYFYWNRKEITVRDYFFKRYRIPLPFDTLLIYDADGDMGHVHPLPLLNFRIEGQREPIYRLFDSDDDEEFL